MPRPRSWSDDDLRHHLPIARSWSDLRRRLGLVGGGTTTDRLRARCRELDLDTSHLPARGQQPRRWTDDQLRVAVAEGTCLADVFGHLGLRIGGSAWRRMQDHILRLGLDTSHWTPRAVQPGGSRTMSPHPSMMTICASSCLAHVHSPRSCDSWGSTRTTGRTTGGCSDALPTWACRSTTWPGRRGPGGARRGASGVPWTRFSSASRRSEADRPSCVGAWWKRACSRGGATVAA